MRSWEYFHSLTPALSIYGEGEKPIAYFQSPVHESGWDFCLTFLFVHFSIENELNLEQELTPIVELCVMLVNYLA